MSETIISTHILTRRMTFHLGKSVQVLEYFNSHPHEEDDDVSNNLGWNITISTHILTRRMTTFEDIYKILEDISTHILTRRMTAREVRRIDRRTFQLTSSRGG